MNLLLAGALPFHVPKILNHGEDYFITTWAPGRPMKVSPSSLNSNVDIDFLASIYASIDNATKLSGNVRSGLALPNELGANETDRLQRVLATVPYGKHVDSRIIEKALSKLEQDIELPVARLTHADLTPQHVLRTPGGKTTVIDFDSCSLLWPRFYDVVNYAYNAAVYNINLVPLSRRLIERFFENINEPITKHRRTLNVIAAVRGLSSIYEHLSEPNSFHNTSDQLTNSRAAFIEHSLGLIARGRYFLSD